MGAKIRTIKWEEVIPAWIARVHGPNAVVNDVRRPDKEERRKKAPDLEFLVDQTRYFAEHTEIEPHEGTLQEQEAFTSSLFALNGQPLGPYHLIPRIRRKAPRSGVKALNALRSGRDSEAIRARVLDWIAATAASLEPGQQVEGELPEVPFPLVLRHDVSLRRTLWVSRFAIDSDLLETWRRERVQRALHEKIPKVVRYAQRIGATSVLVLESTDIAQSGAMTIVPMVAAELRTREDLVPDLVVLLDTAAGEAEIAIVKHGAEVFDEPIYWGLATERRPWPPLPLSPGVPLR